MKRILLLATGGTIATKKTEEGLTPQLTSQELLDCIPEIADLCAVETLQLFNLDSTNLSPAHWITIAQAIHTNYDRFDGFVITHGTDTMAYTAAALSYLIQGSPKPIVLTGAQQSIDNRETDARRNLTDAFRYAASDCAWGVTIVFDGRVILGTRARKMRSKSYHAFAGIGYPDAALIRDGRVFPILPRPTLPDAPAFSDALNPRVFVLKLIPGVRANLFHLLENDYDAVILEGFGVGGVPYYADQDFGKAVGEWIAKGKLLIMTTQVTYEGSDMSVYRVGHIIKQQYDIIEAYDMTLEAVVTKTMWLLGTCRDGNTFRERFYTPVEHDILIPE
jgi:L-asparaginase